MNKVTVIIPNFNNEKYIKQCISSVLEQTYKNLEVIVFDDASTDGSLGIINQFKDKRLQVVCLPINTGSPVAAIKAGIKNAKGKYWMYVSGDDFLDKNAIDMLLLGMNDDCNYVYGNFNVIDGKIQGSWNYGSPTDEELINGIYKKRRGLIPMTGLFLTKFLRTFEWSDLEHSDDTMTSIIACEHGWKRKHIDYYYYYYRIHGKNVTFNSEKRAAAIKEILKYIERRYNVV